MIKFISRAALIAFIYANTTIILRLAIFLTSFFCLNIFYTKWENLLLLSNPDSLFILLSLYNLIIFILMLWFFLSLPFFSSISRSKKTLEVRKSIADRSDQYSKIKDVRLYPKLKSSINKSLEEQ